MNDRTLEVQIGINLKYLRTKTFKEKRNKFNELIVRRLTQDDLAKYLGITFQQIQKYENAINCLDAVKIYKLSKFFGVPIDYFYDEHLIEKQTYTKLFREQDVQTIPHNI